METKILIGLGKSSYSNIEVNLKENENLDVVRIKNLIKQSLECVEVVTEHENNVIILVTEKQANIIKKYFEKYNDMILEYVESCGKKEWKELTKDEGIILVNLIIDTENASSNEEATPVTTVPHKVEEVKPEAVTPVTKKEPFPSNKPVDTTPLPTEEKKAIPTAKPSDVEEENVPERVQIKCNKCGGTNIKLDKHNKEYNGKVYDIYVCNDCPSFINAKGFRQNVSTWIEV